MSTGPTPRRTADGPIYSVPPVERALKLLRHIAAGDPVVNISHTARALAISRTTLIRLMATLEAERMIEVRREGGYKLGLGLAGLAAQALFAADIVQVADPLLADLADRLGLSSHLGVIEGREVLYVARRTPNLHLVSNVRIGSRLPAHATSLGRIILAYMPREAVIALFDGVRLQASTPKTPTTMPALLRQIDQDRAEGLAWSDQNYEAGIASVAAPVFDHAGKIAGAINVTGPTRGFEGGALRHQEIAAEIAATADRISRGLGHLPPPDARRGVPDRQHRRAP